MITKKQIRNMSAVQIIAAIRVAAMLEKNNKAITYDAGVELVNVIAIHGDKIADLMERALPEDAFND